MPNILMVTYKRDIQEKPYLTVHLDFLEYKEIEEQENNFHQQGQLLHDIIPM